MKNKNIYTKLLLAGSLCLLSGTLTSCNDFLTMLPTNQLPEENFWQDESDLNNVRASGYDKLAQPSTIEKIIQWGELRSDNLTLNAISNTNISYLQDAVLQPNNSMFDWSAFYAGINYCNLVLEKGAEMTVPGKEVDPGFTRSDYNKYLAEMTALRSLYYFYLVKSFRDVPYITSSIRTDKQALSIKPAATPGVAILGDCIAQLEAVVNYAPENYGDNSENKGRFTKKSVNALIADMSLWRACMLKDYMSKDANATYVNTTDVVATDDQGNATGGYKTAEGKNIDNTYCNEQCTAYLNKAKTYAQRVIDILQEDRNKRNRESTSASLSDEENPQVNKYPLYLNDRNATTITDASYAKNFGNQNSNESILELQYDGSVTKSSYFNDYYSSYSNNSFVPGIMTLSNTLTSSANTVNPTIGFGKTDLRLIETCYYPSSDPSKPISKFIARTIDTGNSEDLTSQLGFSGVSARTSESMDAHWPVYRLTDIMLIKAEAIARLSMNSKDASLKEGYELVNEIFKRNNPALVTTAEAKTNTAKKDLGCDRLDGDAYCTDNKGNVNKTGSDLLSLIYRERQREFIGEGKRWYDLVRQAEFSYVTDNKSTATALAFGSFKSQVTSRLSKLLSLYNPIYVEELKVNGVGYTEGGKLVQNPIWERYTKN